MSKRLGAKARKAPLRWLRRLNSAARLTLDRRAGVALIVGFTTPVLLLAVAMGVEVGYWADVKLQLQRVSDMAALAGAEAYGTNGSAALSATAAANVAELNGASAAATRTWNAASKTLADGDITIQITNGVNNPSDPAVRVTVARSVPLTFSRIAVHRSSITLQATALSEVATTANGAQPCILTLNGASNGVTTSAGVTLSGNVDANLYSCTAVSDGTMLMNGNVTFNADGLYAGGTITLNGNISGTATTQANQHPHSSQISDPYASDTTLQNAIAQASCSPATTVKASGNGVVNLYPNVCYGSISLSGNQSIVFNGTGLYTINGNLTVSGNTSLGGTAISGTGITVVTTGSVSLSGNFNTNDVAMTAPTSTSATNGAIPGVLFATAGTGGISISGNQGVPFTGLIYAPNAPVTFSGNSTDGSTGCSEVVVNTLTMSGNTDLAANCSGYGLLSYGSQPSTTAIGLVQ